MHYLGGIQADRQMEQLDILIVAAGLGDFYDKPVQWRAKVERISGNIVYLHVKRKIMAEDHVDYIVRVTLKGMLQLHEGDKVQVEGTIPEEMETQRSPGNIRHIIELGNPRVSVLTNNAGKEVKETRTQTEN